MAKDIQVPVFGTALQRIFRLQGRITPRMDEIIIPTLEVGNLSACTEPPVCRTAICDHFIPGAAAARSAWIFDAPIGTIALIKSIWVRTSQSVAIVQFRMGTQLTLTTPVVADSEFADGRLLGGLPGTPQNPACTVTGGTSVATISSPTFVMESPTTGHTIFPNKWVIGSGTAAGALTAQSFGAVNESMNFAIEWDEYPLV